MIGAADIVVRLGDENIVLHPALRHALRLARRPGAFKQLVQDINEGSLTAACDIISPHYAPPHLINLVFDAGLDRLRMPLLAYVMACAGIDDTPTDTAGAKPDQKAQSFEAYLLELYRIGTGWLGWTPETTWDATPDEITEAYKGRLSMLKALFGAPDQDKPKADLSDKFKAIFAAQGTTKVTRHDRH